MFTAIACNELSELSNALQLLEETQYAELHWLFQKLVQQPFLPHGFSTILVHPHTIEGIPSMVSLGRLAVWGAVIRLGCCDDVLLTSFLFAYSFGDSCC